MKIESIIELVDEKLIKRLTKDLVAFDSQNPPGSTIEITKYLQEECKSLGFDSKIYSMDEHRSNIVITFGKGEKDIVLSGHLDTVPIGDESQWKYPPLQVTEKDGKLFGRGTVDMKGGVASLIAVMDAISRSNIELNYRLVFAGTADEEVGMNGAFHLKEKGVMDNAVCLIITEATDLKVGIAEKGPYWIRMKVKGKAAHGSMPEVGINAIEGVCIGIKALKEIIPTIKHDLLGQTTLNVGMINGGAKINVVPEDCNIDCDFRLVPEVKQEKLDSSITELMKELSNENDCQYTHEILHTIPALETNKDESIVQGLMKWSKRITNSVENPIGLAYGTDAAALIPPDNIPFVIIGGGSPSVLHQSNEYVHFSDLVDASKIIIGGVLEAYSER
ncbi:MAG: M20 family peptidase [Candidatus Heimdallarchaeota archaeon]|nr:MAG: M20 family peptidase [Candidatus Heimdallarchaeota archaeon]